MAFRIPFVIIFDVIIYLFFGYKDKKNSLTCSEF
jgi:hypothetical protein